MMNPLSSESIPTEKRGNLQRQVISRLLFVFITISLISIVLDYLSIKRTLHENYRETMQQVVNHLVLSFDKSSSYRDAIETMNRFCRVMSHHNNPGHEITLYDKDGQVVASTKKVPASVNSPSPPDSTEQQEVLSETWEQYKIGNEEYIAITSPFQKQWRDKSIEGSIRYVEPVRPINQAINRLFLYRSVAQGLLLIVISMLVYWILRQKVLLPLDRLFMHTYAVSKGDMVAWKPTDTGNEIDDIQVMFNFMVEQINKHEKEATRKERQSAISETIAQVYHTIVTRNSTIKSACNNLDDNGDRERHYKEHLAIGIIKNECEAILDDLVNLQDLFDDDLFDDEDPPHSKRVFGTRERNKD